MSTNVNSVDQKLPIKQLFPLGLQHVLAMYAGALAVPLIVGGAIGLDPQQITYLIAADLFTCGIATLLQALGVGNWLGIKLPVILGCSFVAVSPMIAIGKAQGLPVIYGAVIAGGLFVVICSFFFGKILKFFPPLVTGSVILTVGLSLTPVALNNAGGGAGKPDFGDPKHLLLAAFTLIVVLIMNRYFKGFMQAVGVLIGLVAGTAVAGMMGMLHFGEVGKAGWFQVIHPFYFGTPQFHLDSIITMCLVSLVCMIEAIGVFMGLGGICDKKISEKDITKGLRAEGIAQMLGGTFNSFPYTTFSQNVGLVVLSGVRSRYVCVMAGAILVVLGLIPKIGALATVIPVSVLGGATLAMFGMVAASGIRILSQVDLQKPGNLLTIAVAVGMGIGSKIVPKIFEQLPHFAKLFFEDPIVCAALFAIVLNIFFNWKDIMANKVEMAAHDEHVI